MTYVTTLTCDGCKGSLRFENERPDWKTYDYRVEQADECERSARFVSENIDKPLPGEGCTWPEWEEAGRPKFIFEPSYFHMRGNLSLNIPRPYEYIVCPTCDSHVKKPSPKGPQ